MATTLNNTNSNNSEWFLQVAVAGKANPMFLSDNLTPAPRNILLQQLYGDKHPSVRSSSSSEEDQDSHLLDTDTEKSPSTVARTLDNKDQNDLSLPNSPNSSRPNSPQTKSPRTNSLSSNKDSFSSSNKNPSRCNITLVAGIPQNIETKEIKNNKKDDLMTVREEDDIDSITPQQTPKQSTSSLNSSSSTSSPKLNVLTTSGFGQDAWLVLCNQNKQIPQTSSHKKVLPSFLLGIADGVGGWRSSGVDSGIMSRQMMENTVDLLRNETDVDQIITAMHHPKVLLERAYDKIIQDQDVEAGSTTACLLSFVSSEHHNCTSQQTITAAPVPITNTNTDNATATTTPVVEKTITPSEKLFLHTCNLGDSGFCVIRDERVIFHSSPQRDIHHVHQLAVIPASLRAQHHDSEYEYADDKPDDALCACCELHENDVIILASDGLWDNIQPKDEIVTVPGVGLARLRYKQDAPERTLFQHQTIAQCIIDSRSKNSDDVDVEKVCEKLGTYAVELMGMQEGKPDDLTILCTQIKKTKINNDAKENDDNRANRVISPTSIMSV